MKTKYKLITLVAVAAAIGAFTSTTFSAEEKEETVTMDQVPQEAKDTLKKYADESEVKKVEKSDSDGTKVFEFEIEKGGKKFEVAITPEGKFWGREEDIELTAMPEAVQKALQAEAGEGKISGGEKALDKDQKVTYEADIEKDGKKFEIAVDAEGHVVNKENASGEKKESDEKGEKGEKDEKDEKN